MNRRRFFTGAITGAAVLAADRTIAGADDVGFGPLHRYDVDRSDGVPHYDLVTVHRFDLYMAASAVWIAARTRIDNGERPPRVAVRSVRRGEAIDAARATFALLGTSGLIVGGDGRLPGRRIERLCRRRARRLFPELTA